MMRLDYEAGAALLVEQYRHLLWYVCARRLQNPEDAWECVYEALADFCLQWEKFRLERGSLKNYLVSIADRKALDLYRRNRNWERAKQVAAEQKEERKNPEMDLLASWLLEGFTQKERTIVLLKCVHQMSYAEIARMLSLPYEQTKKCGYRCLQRMRKKISSKAKG